jgi:hypothetical protein
MERMTAPLIILGLAFLLLLWVVAGNDAGPATEIPLLP